MPLVNFGTVDGREWWTTEEIWDEDEKIVIRAWTSDSGAKNQWPTFREISPKYVVWRKVDGDR